MQFDAIAGCKLHRMLLVILIVLNLPMNLFVGRFTYITGSHILIFTDGSVFNGPVGSGACAAVFFPASDTEDIQTFTNAVGSKVSSIDCEVAGILLGINTAIDYFHSCESQQTIENVL